MSNGINLTPLFSMKKGEFPRYKTRYMKNSFRLMLFLMLFLLLNGRAWLWAAENQIVFSNDTVPTHEASQIVVSSDLQEDSSETFVLPDIYEISINMIYPGEGDKKTELTTSIKKLLIEGRGKDAAQKIGEVLGRQRKNSKAYLGFYCKKALPSIMGGLNERAQFLSWFLIGYGKSGLVMVSKEGIEKLSASGRRRGEFWKLVEDGRVPSEKLERIYETDDAVYIPFSSGEVFILDIVGSDQGEAAVWKILPEGINRKTWSAGPWEREITIRGDRVN